MEEKFNELFLEPSKYYAGGLNEEHHHVVEEYLADLVKQSGIDVEGNKITAKELHAKQKELAEVNKKLGKTKAMSKFLLIFGIILAVALIGIILLIIRKNKYKNLEKELSDLTAKKQKEVDELLEKSRNEIAPLVSLFNDSMSTDLINKSAPFIQFNNRLDSSFITRMEEQFAYKIDPKLENSTLVIQSGTMRNNPFMIRQYYHQRMVPKIYTGTLLISYQTTVTTNEGTKTITQTQTLVAHVTKDEPAYNVASELIYCNDACPKLSFSRSPTDLYKMNEKQVAKYIDKFEKEDQKKAEKAIKKGTTYTKMANSKFEAYWNSQGRNDEVGYRLMFTPLAQTNIVHLFSLKEPYGDDVYYTKIGCVSTVATRHSQSMDYSGGIYNYTADTYEEVETKFMNYNLEFFQGMMFDFFPLISIPIFHQNVSAPFLGSENVKYAVPKYEVEVMANKLDGAMFKAEGSSTDVIIEAKHVSSANGIDNVEIIGHTFIAIPRVELVPTLGGDGKMHPVPVHYFDYEPLEKVVKAKAYKNSANLNKNSGTLISYKDFALEILQ